MKPLFCKSLISLLLLMLGNYNSVFSQRSTRDCSASVECVQRVLTNNQWVYDLGPFIPNDNQLEQTVEFDWELRTLDELFQNTWEDMELEEIEILDRNLIEGSRGQSQVLNTSTTNVRYMRSDDLVNPKSSNQKQVIFEFTPTKLIIREELYGGARFIVAPHLKGEFDYVLVKGFGGYYQIKIYDREGFLPLKLPPNSFYPLQIDNSGGLPLNSDARSRGVRNSVTLGFFYNPEEHSIILVRNANTTLNEIKRNILLSLVPKK